MVVGCSRTFTLKKFFGCCLIQEHQLRALGHERLYLLKVPESLTHETIDTKIEFGTLNWKKIECVFFLKRIFLSTLSYKLVQKNKSMVPLF